MTPGTCRRALVAVELVTGAAAVSGGALLVLRPDGSLLHADVAALTGSPFSDWRLPGALLATLVGGGYLLTATATARRWRGSAALTVLAGSGLVLFETAEWTWLGPHPLEAVFAGIGVGLLVAVWRQRPRPA